MTAIGAPNRASPFPLDTRVSAECTWLIRAGSSPAETLLWLTKAETISAVSWMYWRRITSSGT